MQISSGELKKIKIIATDMDHTLLLEDSSLPPGIGDYVERLEQADIYLAIASGRPLYTLQELFREVQDKLCFISDNGGLITVKGSIVYKSLMEAADYQKMHRVTCHDSTGISVICGLDTAYIDEKYRCYDAVFGNFYSRITYVEDMDSVIADANKFTVYFPNGDAGEQYEALYAPLFGARFSVTIAGDIWIDIMNCGVHKGNAMKRLGEYLGYGTDRMMAFGDHYNDMEMLETVKYGVAVENAVPELKACAGYVTGANEDMGVLRLLDRVLEAQAV